MLNAGCLTKIFRESKGISYGFVISQMLSPDGEMRLPKAARTIFLKHNSFNITTEEIFDDILLSI